MFGDLVFAALSFIALIYISYFLYRYVKYYPTKDAEGNTVYLRRADIRRDMYARNMQNHESAHVEENFRDHIYCSDWEVK